MAHPRRLLVRLHLWLGLSLGALMVLAGLTGAALVYYVEIDGLLHPEQAATGMATPQSWDRAIATVHRAFPAATGPWRIEVTDRPGAIPMRHYGGAGMSAQTFAPLMVWLSPDGARVLRRDTWGDHAMTWIYDLHYRLQLGRAGGVAFGWLGLALLALLLTGLAAWWPRGSWAKALRIKRHAAPTRSLRDVHKLTGLAALPLLLMLTATGVMLELPDETSKALTPLLGPPDAMPAPLATTGQGPRIPPSRAVAAARAAMPQATPAWIEVPGTASANAPYRLRLRQRADPGARFPHSWAIVDPHSGRVLATQDARHAAPQSRLVAWLHPLHDGSAGGTPLRAALILAGLFPLVLFITGVARWRRNRAISAQSAVARKSRTARG